MNEAVAMRSGPSAQWKPAIGIPGALASAAGVDGSAAWLEPGQTRRWSIAWRALVDDPIGPSGGAASGQ